MKIEIVQGDVTQQPDIDAIVNATDATIIAWHNVLTTGILPPVVRAAWDRLRTLPNGDVLAAELLRDLNDYWVQVQNAINAGAGGGAPPIPPPAQPSVVPVYVAGDHSGIQLDAEKQAQMPGGRRLGRLRLHFNRLYRM